MKHRTAIIAELFCSLNLAKADIVGKSRLSQLLAVISNLDTPGFLDQQTTESRELAEKILKFVIDISDDITEFKASQ